MLSFNRDQQYKFRKRTIKGKRQTAGVYFMGGSVRVGVIGYGYWGPNLVRNLAELPSAQLVVVADMKQERLDRVKGMYPRLEVTQNYKDLFEMGLDAVVVATPPATHYSIARECLEHGLNVLVEKPLTIRTEDSASLVDIAAQRGLKLMVGNTFEYNSAVLKLRDLVASGELGDIYYVDAVRTNLGLFQPNVNAMWDLAPHDISILLCILGMHPTHVSAIGNASVFRHIHDLVHMHMRFANNISAHIQVSWLSPEKVRKITVVGSKKMVVYDDMETVEKIKIYDKGVDAPPYTETFSEFQCSYRSGDVVIPHISFVEPLRAEVSHFVESIVNNSTPRSDGVVGMKIVSILETASESLKSGGEMLPVITPETVVMPNMVQRALSEEA
jgi:predicted dehydrogenase